MDASHGTAHPAPDTTRASLDPRVDPVTLTEQLVDIPSESGAEGPLADAVERALRDAGHLEVQRFGHTLVARTQLGLDERVVVAGHLDTVPAHDNLPSRRDETTVHGLGSCDMKGGVAVALHLAATLPRTARDVTYLFYECEEVEAERNGLSLLAQQHPELLEADFAVLMEPSNGVVEAGCQGTLRVEVTTTGRRAHSARSWRGHNAIHEARSVLEILADYEPRQPEIDGLRYHEGLNAVRIHGGVAGNVIPDRCTVEVNFRYAPDRTEQEALDHVTGLFSAFEVAVTDSAPAAMPGLSLPAAAAFVDAVGGRVNPKFGWTDVARFSGLGIPAVNFGPGDPLYAHTQDEQVPIAQIEEVAAQLRAWLAEPGSIEP